MSEKTKTLAEDRKIREKSQSEYSHVGNQDGRERIHVCQKFLFTLQAEKTVLNCVDFSRRGESAGEETIAPSSTQFLKVNFSCSIS